VNAAPSKKIQFGILGFVTTAVFVTCSCFASDEDSGDLEVWSTIGINWKMNDKWRLILSQALRFNDDASDFYYSHSDVGLVYAELLQDVDLGLNYRAIFDHEEDDDIVEHRPYLTVFGNPPLFNVDIHHRTMLEFRDLKDRDDAWRFRYRILFNEPFEAHVPDFAKPLPKAGKFYFGDEVFIDFEGEQFNRNRVIVGYQFELFENTIADTHYYWQLDKDDSDWDTTHIIGLSIRYNF
jgi:hypothetical protein